MYLYIGPELHCLSLALYHAPYAAKPGFGTPDIGLS